jgi:hypothetical protein
MVPTGWVHTRLDHGVFPGDLAGPEAEPAVGGALLSDTVVPKTVAVRHGWAGDRDCASRWGRRP